MDETRLFDLYERLAELQSEKRQEELASLRESDPALAERLGRMLASETEADALFDKPLVVDEATQGPRPVRIGRYELLSELGHGGSGRVFRARQAQPDRIVALKILRDALVSETQKRRFLQEIELLGRLEHPGISAIYDAGLDELQDEEGRDLGKRLWFTMELVDGEPITRFAQEHDLSIEARVRLLVQVADAMEHAHQRGVLHRDLKPANVLASESETASGETSSNHAWGRIKVLDFGIGRLEDDQQPDLTELTVQGARLGTLAYMSPEQLAGRNDDIDTRSDIWSLGVLAYELLSGLQPFPPTGLSLLEMERRVVETEPTALHGTRPGIDKDLETIVAKAMEKDKDRRYASIGAMGEDLRRYLAGETILARPATAAYQLRKFAGRHRGLVAGMALALFLLVAGSIAVLIFAWKAERASERAQVARRGMRELNDLFQEELIEAASPERTQGETPTLQTLLTGLESRLEERFDEHPLVRAELLRTLGKTYTGLDRLEAAERSLRAALAIQEKELGPSHVETLETRAPLGTVLSLRGKHDEAMVFRRRSVALAAESLPISSELRLGLLGDLGHQIGSKGDPVEAETLLREVVRLRTKYLGPEHEETLIAINNLASQLADMGQYEEALAMHEDMFEKRRRLFGADHPWALNSLNNLALAYFRCERYEEGLPLARECLERKRKVYGDLHQRTFDALNNLGLFLSQMGKVQEAYDLFNDVMPKVVAKFGDDHPVTIRMRSNLAYQCLALDKVEQAHGLVTKSLHHAEKLYGPRHWILGVHHNRMSEVYDKQGRGEEAWKERSLAFSILLEGLGPEHPRTKGMLERCEKLARDLGDPGRAKALEAEMDKALQKEKADRAKAQNTNTPKPGSDPSNGKTQDSR